MPGLPELRWEEAGVPRVGDPIGPGPDARGSPSAAHRSGGAVHEQFVVVLGTPPERVVWLDLVVRVPLLPGLGRVLLGRQQPAEGLERLGGRRGR